jgi:hypothetical protein
LQLHRTLKLVISRIETPTVSAQPFDIAAPRQIFSCANLAACLSAGRSVS